MDEHFRAANDRTPGVDGEYTGGPGGPGIGFCGSRGGLFVLVAVAACQ